MNLKIKDVASAVISAIIVSILTYIVSLTDVWTANLHQIVNIAVLTGATSLLKAMATSSTGKIAGIKIK